MNNQPTLLALVGRSASRRPFASETKGSPQSNAAYRRLAATILGLDVTSLAGTLQAARLQNAQAADRAA